MTIVNLTPHPLEFRSSRDCFCVAGPDLKAETCGFCGGSRVIGAVLRFESSGIARCEAKDTAIGGIHGLFPTSDGVHPDDTVIPIVVTEFGAITGLPAPLKDTIYVVSSITAQACPERDDVFVPAQPIRDAQGRIVACAALGKITTSRAARCEAAVRKELGIDSGHEDSFACSISNGDSWGLGYRLLDAWQGTKTPLSFTVHEVSA